jgi:hypothetical protein
MLGHVFGDIYINCFSAKEREEKMGRKMTVGQKR